MTIQRFVFSIMAVCLATACKDLSPDTTPAQIAIAPASAATIAQGRCAHSSQQATVAPARIAGPTQSNPTMR